MEINEYGYKEYLNEVKNNPTQENINRLGTWFERYGTDYWNGERFDADGFSLYPVIEWDDEMETGTTVGYEMKY